ncbi:hypothetical protein CEE36_07230 [candidate division TA06 bacterium B3_TA06]|uniref:YvlB/LiaX N-terminal domain-containing protein n=1 Tax=candidate division TA06 bacterium B3_TA06 TaxID=2012487 RepID=A0A532V658_UNCT6|nr:MAG: hypothetical protein CEE36_07230 [candidate division TA06 bacterium B3_TA06]
MNPKERILKLLEDGKITADEAARLLKALGEPCCEPKDECCESTSDECCETKDEECCEPDKGAESEKSESSE